MSELRQQILSSLQPEDVDAIPDSTLVALARRLESHLSQAAVAPERDGWLDFDGAVAHLRMKPGALYKLTASKAIPFEQDGPGCRLWFRRSELDEWRRAGGSRRVRSQHLKAA
jgi:hypothetical protein